MGKLPPKEEGRSFPAQSWPAGKQGFKKLVVTILAFAEKYFHDSGVLHAKVRAVRVCCAQGLGVVRLVAAVWV